MAVEDVVTLVTEYCADGQDTFEDLHGPEAAIVAEDAIDLLKGELSGQLNYDALWAEFEAAPGETAPDLAGALEAVIEADPGLAEKLEALIKEYYAAGRQEDETIGPEMAEPRSSEFVPGEKARIQAHEAEPRSHTDTAGEGTYLYGNVRAGDVTVGKALEPGPDVLEVREEHQMLGFDVHELFQQLQVTIGGQLELSEQEKDELREHLERLESQLMLGEEAEEARIVEHLRRLGAADPDFLALLLEGLRHTQTEAQATVKNAIERVTE